MKLCIDCKHMDINHSDLSHIGKYEFAVCNRPTNQVSLVDGSMLRNKTTRFCYIERCVKRSLFNTLLGRDKAFCGETGMYWEERNEHRGG